ncbi:hypothetical protein PXW85_27385, partial [Klebsiella pneumoniae]|uniref:hypothetical protein n=1 Tax=Klebsiella pneumoniae TaxID=573 RepID=UPI0023814CED
VMVNGKPRHVLGYLQDFLFHPKRAMTPVRALSGGERNRLLLANLFPFIYMKVGGISSEIELLEIPNVLFTEDYARLGTFF